MINILLIGEDKNYCINLSNAINLKNNDIKICAIVTDYKEIQFFIREYNIDIILINLETDNFKQILNENYIKKKQYENSIILLLEKDNTVSDFESSPYIYSVINKFNNIKEICEQINRLYIYKIQEKKKIDEIKQDEIIKSKIIEELTYLGYNSLHKGSKYLIETIYIIYNLKTNIEYDLEIDIYPLVAKKYGTSWNNVKSAIRYATDIMYYNNEEVKINEYLKEYNFSKFGASVIILAILDKIKTSEKLICNI